MNKWQNKKFPERLEFMKEKSQYRSHLIQKEFAGTDKLLVWVKKKKKK